jgi:hypothetical protein
LFDLTAHGLDVAELCDVSRDRQNPPASTLDFSAERAAVSRPWITVFAPCCAKTVAMAAPMPWELPVTKAILAFNRSMLSSASGR